MREFIKDNTKLIIILTIVGVVVLSTIHLQKLRRDAIASKTAIADKIKANQNDTARDKYLETISITLSNGFETKVFNTAATIVNEIFTDSNASKTILFSHNDFKYYNTLTNLKITTYADPNLSLTLQTVYNNVKNLVSVVSLGEGINISNKGSMDTNYLKVVGSYIFDNNALKNRKRVYIGTLTVANKVGEDTNFDLVLECPAEK